jgi:hypothetical protein
MHCNRHPKAARFQVALAFALAASACSGSEPSTTPEGDAATQVATSTPDGAVSDSTSNVEDATSSEASACSLVPTGPETCNAVLQQSAVITSSCTPDALPPAQGGTVDDGTYVLKSLTYYAGQCPPSPDVERITWVVCGTQWEIVEDLLAPDGGTQNIRLNLTRANQANMLSSSITCRPGGQPSMADAQAYTASPGKFVVQVKTATGTRIDTFTKI